MPQTSTDKQSLLPTIISPAQCSHNLSLLDACPSLYQIPSQTGVNHATISGMHSTYSTYPCKLAGGYLFKVSAVDTHSEQQLISSWKTRNGNKVTKTLLDIKDQPLITKHLFEPE